MKIEGGLSKTAFSILAGLILLVPQNSRAQSAVNDNYIVNCISMSDGLPANFVDYIYKDSSGFVWIATSGGGLSRFDGNDFLNLTSHSTPRLKSNFITCITEDSFRRLWISSESGLDVLDLETLRCNALTVPQLNELDNRVIRFVTTDAEGNVWLKCSDTIYRISFNWKGDVDDVLTFTDSQVALQDNFIKDVEGNGTVWTTFNSKMVKLLVNDGKILPVTVFDNLPIVSDAYVSDCILKDNEVWVSTSDGLLRCNRITGETRHYQHSESDDKSLSQNFLTDLEMTWDGQLLVSSLKGLNVYDTFNDCFERINSDRNNGQDLTLSSDFINCIIAFGKQIWIGTESAGIAVISPKLLSVKNYANDRDRPTSIAPNPVNSILADGKGRVWTGGVESGLCWTRPGSGVFHRFTTGNSDLSHNSVSALECDNDGNLWVGTWGGGISILSLDGLRFTRNIRATALPLSYIGALKYDPVNDYMWIGSNVGIYVYNPASDNIVPVLKEQPYGNIGTCIDGKDRMWIGCHRGVYVFDLHSRNNDAEGNMFSARLISPGSAFSDRVNCVSVTSDGTLWIGTNGNGIYRLDSEGGDGGMHFTRFSTEDGLSNNMAKGILDDSFGRLWISTEYGLSRFNPKTLAFTNYYTEHGLSSSQFYWNAAVKLSDGTLYFGQVNGLTVVTPQQEFKYERKFNLKFTRLTIGEKVVFAGGKSTDVDIAYSDEVRMHQRDKSIGFEFALLDFGTASPAIYSYRLKGFDDEWVTLRQNRQYVSFTSLPAGRYTLQVRATDSEAEILGENEIKLYVAGYFYKSWWFILLMCAFVLVAIILFVRLRTRYLSRQREELQNTVAERTREISEQKKLLELKAEELDSQNRILVRQNEELAGHRILFSQELRQTDVKKDDGFVEKLIEAIRGNYKNPDLDVNDFCKVMGMSKTLLNRRLQDSLGQSIGQFIRTYRLSLAREMLINNKESKIMNVSEIAYEVGFNDPKYFTRCFAKEFGAPPSFFSKNECPKVHL
ncbi:MAG: helix-turn-helix domain-containing protein [Bacteroidales bacterium]|nr:helix-turn-helix domain-containing protein [Candidatus Hennigimonas equi]